MSGENEIAVECGLRMVEAPDGVQIPVPSGAVGGVYNEHGGDVSIHPQAPVRISANNGGYYVVVNNTPPANGEASDLFDNLTAESLEYLLERALVRGAPVAFRMGLAVAGLLADVFTASRITREIFIRGEYQGVPVQYCLLV